MPGASIPYSIVRYFQSVVTRLTGRALDLLKSPKRDLELNKAKLLYQYCQEDMRQVMDVINLAAKQQYLLDHPSLAIVYGQVERLLFSLQEGQRPKEGWLDRRGEEAAPMGYLDRSDYQERQIVL